HHFVGPVRRPDVLGRETVSQIRRKGPPQVRGLAIGIAIQGRGRAKHLVGDVPGGFRARPVRVLVGVELDRYVELRGAVRLVVPQLLPNRHPGGRTHPSVLTATAVAWPGRSSASANTFTPSPTARRAS